MSIRSWAEAGNAGAASGGSAASNSRLVMVRNLGKRLYHRPAMRFDAGQI
jgi:hypothetical protein